MLIEEKSDRLCLTDGARLPFEISIIVWVLVLLAAVVVGWALWREPLTDSGALLEVICILGVCMMVASPGLETIVDRQRREVTITTSWLFPFQRSTLIRFDELKTVDVVARYEDEGFELHYPRLVLLSGDARLLSRWGTSN